MAAEEDAPDDQGNSRFPYISLEKAIERVKVLHKAGGDHPIPVMEAAKLWGFGEKASGWRQTVAACKYYGLVDTVGAKEARRVKLSPDARRYFLDERPEEHEKAHAIFALKPVALSSLWKIWKAKPPADQIARSNLKLDFGYAENAAAQILAIYKANIVFAALERLGAESLLAGDVGLERGEISSLTELGAPPVTGAGVNIRLGDGTLKTSPVAGVSPEHRAMRVDLMDGERELTTGLLSKEASFRVIVTGKIGSREIERLIKKLELDKEILSEPDQDDSDEPRQHQL